LTPEFSRRFALDSIGSTPRTVNIEATQAERMALATRFDLAALEALGASATLTTGRSGVETQGRLIADVVQRCVVTGEPVATQIDEAFTLRFVDPELLISDNDEIELNATDCDLVALEDGAVDLGEAVAQTLGLVLDPFPRCEIERARADERKWAAGEEAGPFSGLKGLLSS
jgi:uncharacterized metal-binding protein YceD (DUF177 family)